MQNNARGVDYRLQTLTKVCLGLAEYLINDPTGWGCIKSLLALKNFFTTTLYRRSDPRGDLSQGVGVA